jgi:hypothetical protein
MMRMTVDVSDGMIPVAALGLELNGSTAALKMRKRTVVASLTTQRNAVQMLHDRMNILLQYVSAVINSELGYSAASQVSPGSSDLSISSCTQRRHMSTTHY